MNLKLTVLGCGSSAGVPRVGMDWGACDPAEPRNRRSRSGLMIRADGLTVLIDTPPELREQLNDAKAEQIDQVFFTHCHADQTHGIDELRGFFIKNRQRIGIHADPETLAILKNRFDYCFQEIAGYPPILIANEISGPVELTGATGKVLTVTPIFVVHGPISALGYRFDYHGKSAAYLPDVSEIPEPEGQKLDGLDCLILDALRYRTHPTHINVETALSWIDRCKPGRAVLTDMHIDLDYQTLSAELPDGVEPAYDGMDICL